MPHDVTAVFHRDQFEREIVWSLCAVEVDGSVRVHFPIDVPGFQGECFPASRPFEAETFENPLVFISPFSRR